jgi:ornithine cyclodeaminase/alanine dehydrogenase-like protein (mu-crystallin family)
MIAPRMVSADALRAAIGFEALIEPMAEAFRQSSAGEADNGLITMFPAAAPADGDVYVKTGTLRGRDIFIVKVSPWFARNMREGRAQGGFVAVFDSATGHTRAILNDEHYLSDIRTAATGALAARLFAPTSVDTAAILGTGVQAYWQCLAVHHERPYRRLLILGRTIARAMALRDRLALRLPNVAFDIVADIEPAVRAADVLITATPARDPIVRGEWLRPGQLVIAVGADDPTKCELDAAALLRARVIVDARDTAAANGDIHRAMGAGHALERLVTAELGEVIAGRVPNRASAQDMTIVKLVGIGAQDVLAAAEALDRLPPPSETDRRQETVQGPD